MSVKLIKGISLPGCHTIATRQENEYMALLVINRNKTIYKKEKTRKTKEITKRKET
jgi:hypothetical protein